MTESIDFTARRAQISGAQHDMLMRPLRKERVASRSQGGKSLSYLEAWDVRAHLTRIFGFGNWDEEVIRERLVAVRDYQNGNKAMLEVIWTATVQVTIHVDGVPLARYTESAVGSAQVGAESSSVGDAHDNALKTAASDAFKRCCVNLGTQFGLSLYDNGNQNDVIKGTLVAPADATIGLPPDRQPGRPAADARVDQALGQVTPTGDGSNEGHVSDEDAAAELERSLGATPEGAETAEA